MPAFTATVPGKTILFGEHAVVYGHPAIAIPLNGIGIKITIRPGIKEKDSIINLDNQGIISQNKLSALSPSHPIFLAISLTEQELEIDRHIPAIIHIHSTIPIAAGLGSSAAIAIAVIRAYSTFLGARLSTDSINRIAYESEKVQHGSPSGIDNAVISFNQPILFQKEDRINVLKIRKPISFILADSKRRTLTKETIAHVHQLRKNNIDEVDQILNEIREIVSLAETAICNGDIKIIGELMTRNQSLLNNLDLSCPELDVLISTSIEAGALGAKLCGGGMGGYMVACVDPAKIDEVKHALISGGGAGVFATKLNENIRIQSETFK